MLARDRLSLAAATQRPAWQRVDLGVAVHHDLAVDDHILDAHRKSFRILARRRSAHRPRIKDGDVVFEAVAQQSALCGAKTLGGKRDHAAG